MKFARSLSLAALSSALALAQTSALAPIPRQQPLSNSGLILPGACLYSYSAGTTTPRTTYSDSTLSTPNTNPVVLDASGRAPAIYMSANSYKFVLSQKFLGACPGSPGTVIWSQDNVYDAGQLLKVALAAATGATLVGYEPTGGTVPLTVASALNTFILDTGYNSFANACAAASGKTLAVTQAWTVGTLSCTASLWFLAGGKLTTSAGAVITLTGTLNAPASQQIFGTTAAGSSVSLGVGTAPQFYPGWWGAKGDDSTDDTAALLASEIATEAINGVLSIPCGSFPFSSQITISKRMTLQGGGDGDAGTGSHACTTLKKTADVIGILVKDGTDYTVLKDFYLTSTAGSGTSDGIVVGEATNTNGAGGVRLQNVFVANQKGNGVNIRNGNSGVLDKVTANANGINGVRISSQQLSSNNTNAWNVYAYAAFSNTQDGLNLDNAAATVVVGSDTEGNGRYGIYSNASAMTIFAHSESNTTRDFFSTASSFGSHVEITTPGGAAKMTCGSVLMYCVNLQSATAPHSSPDGRFGTTGGFTTPLVFPTYGATITINNDLGNAFSITATNGTAFSISAPSGSSAFSQRISVTVRNASGGALGAATWSFVYLMSAWVQPANGFSRSIDFQFDPNTFRWTEMSRTSADIPN